jgi:hypothetical protein
VRADHAERGLCNNPAVFLVIFGAGASYDSVPDSSRTEPPDSPNRPPLAKDLFDPTRHNFREAAFEYHEAGALIGAIRSQVQSGIGVEQALEEYVEYANDGDPETIRGLLAVRYYVAQVVRECARDWTRMAGNVTNYRVLVYHIERWRRQHDDKGLMVTFNYDTLLEDAFRSSGRQLNSIAEYIARDDYRLIKPHGSTDWNRGVWTDVSGGEHAIIDVSPSLDLMAGPIAQGAVTNFPATIPAIAIPTQTKSSFECPQEHLDALEKWLPRVDRILIIGWRAQEQHFLDLLKTHLGKKDGVEALVVSSKQENAQIITSSLELALPEANFHPSAAEGFSHLVASADAVNALLDRQLH